MPDNKDPHGLPDLPDSELPPTMRGVGSSPSEVKDNTKELADSIRTLIQSVAGLSNRLGKIEDAVSKKKDESPSLASSAASNRPTQMLYMPIGELPGIHEPDVKQGPRGGKFRAQGQNIVEDQLPRPAQQQKPQEAPQQKQPELPKQAQQQPDREVLSLLSQILDRTGQVKDTVTQLAADAKAGGKWGG